MAIKGVVSRAELIRFYAKYGFESSLDASVMFGFTASTAESRSVKEKPSLAESGPKAPVIDTSNIVFKRDKAERPGEEKENRVEQGGFLRPVSLGPVSELPDRLGENKQELEQKDIDQVPCIASPKPLMPWTRLHPKLRKLLSSQKQGAEIDTHKLIRHISHGDFIRRIPYRERNTWRPRIHILISENSSMTPFQDEMRAVIKGLKDQVGKSNLSVIEIPKGVNNLVKYLLNKTGSPYTPRLKTSPGDIILILSDMGCLSRNGFHQEGWKTLAKCFQKHSITAVALTPCNARRTSGAMGCLFKTFPLDAIKNIYEPTDALKPKDEIKNDVVQEDIFDDPRSPLFRLLVLLSPARCIEPALLRDVRLLLVKEADAGVEVDFWLYRDMRKPDGQFVGYKDEAGIKWREHFKRLGDSDVDSIIRLFKQYHIAMPDVLAFELKTIKALRPGVNIGEEAGEFIQKLFHTLLNHGQTRINRQAVAEWLLNSRHGLSDDVWEDEDLKWLKAAAIIADNRDSSKKDIPAGISISRLIPQFTPIDYQLALTCNYLTIRPAQLTPSRPINQKLGFITGMPLLTFKSTSRQISVHPLELKRHLIKPDWANAIGEDQYGIYADYIFKGEFQRFRYIPPGRFLMGSPDDEPQRDNDETQHPVVLTKGFWLADTACTQELWTAVMDKTPSHFKGEENLPVEQVSWKDCEKFTERLNDKSIGSGFRFPTEAEWEYACRAGTTTPFNTGENITTEQANYNGNFPYGENPKGEYRRKTVPVNMFEPNGWGLYQMHGNVWEWVFDSLADYPTEQVIDPRVDEKDANRVLRGGSWLNGGGLLRSAFRAGSTPGIRDDNFGFRLARGHLEKDEQARKGKKGKAPRTAVGGPEGGQWVPGFEGVAYTKEVEQSGKIVNLKSDDSKLLLPSHNKIVVKSDYGEYKLEKVSKSRQAKSIGHDQYGLYEDISIEGIIQRFRYIPPGRFLMGSPENELERNDDEVLHPVVLTKGYWLADTACTQELWEVVTKKNPSHFKGEKHLPVEGISWNDCKEFIDKMEKAEPKIGIRFPTEAEWEYACRAGTTSAFNTGDNITTDQANYNGNIPYGNIPKGEYRTQAVPVNEFEPNNWGLYQMHGNVWEWVFDNYDKYSSEEAIDPKVEKEGAFRVLRGGGWDDYGGGLRSACRGRFTPGDRYDSFGFRLARGQLQQEKQGRAG